MVTREIDAEDRGEALRALLVEDDELDAELLATMLGMSDSCRFQFTHARSIEEACRVVSQKRFDIYFVDFCVGDATSLKLLAHLERGGARPIVVSNATAAEAERYGLNAGRCRFLPKGECSPARLGGFVQDALQTRAERHGRA